MTHWLAGKRILIVEDEQPIAETLAYEFTAEGAEVVGSVATADAALDAIGNTDLNVVTLEIKLTGEMTFTVADVLAAGNIPLLFLTGYQASDVPPSPCEGSLRRKTCNANHDSSRARNASCCIPELTSRIPICRALSCCHSRARLASGWLASFYREGVEPSGSLRKVSAHTIILLSCPPDATSIAAVMTHRGLTAAKGHEEISAVGVNHPGDPVSISIGTAVSSLIYPRGVSHTRRREFMAGLGAAAWLVVARAQRASRVARTGFAAFISENAPTGFDRARVFRQGLERLGWAPTIDYFWGVFDVERPQRTAADVLRFRVDVIVSAGTPASPWRWPHTLA